MVESFLISLQMVTVKIYNIEIAFIKKDDGRSLYLNGYEWYNKTKVRFCKIYKADKFRGIHMKKRCFLLTVVACLILGGCSKAGVSQEEYDKVVAERDAYKEALAMTKNGESEEAEVKSTPESAQESTPEPAAETTSDVPGNTTDQQKVVLLNSGWSWTKPHNYVRVYYAVEIQNPNVDYAVEFPTITVTVKNAEGKIIKNDERVLNSIAANDTILYGSDVSYEGEEPGTVEISVSNGKDHYVRQDDNKYVRSDSFVFTNVSENVGGNKTYTGEITNNSSADFGTVSLSVIYKKGEELIGGENSFVDDLEAGTTKVFEVSASSDIGEYDSYSIHAIQW